jgi:outer membrane protein assembly factor BamB
VDSSPAVANGVVYVTDDVNVYGFNARTGALLWSYVTDSDPSPSSPAVMNGVVYAAATGGTLHALDAVTGAKLWSSHLRFYAGSPAAANGVVYITSNQSVYALDGGTGAKLWVYKNKPWEDFLLYVAISNGVLYAGDSRYWQFAFGLK